MIGLSELKQREQAESADSGREDGSNLFTRVRQGQVPVSILVGTAGIALYAVYIFLRERNRSASPPR